MSSRGVLVAKDLFVDKEDLKSIDNIRISKNRDDANHNKKKAFSKKSSSNKNESSYSVICSKRYETLCNGLCTHEECVIYT